MRAAVVAMLREQWMLTRAEAGQRLAMGLGAGAAALVMFDGGANLAFWMLVAVHGIFWLSIARLNGGQLTDGYKPGFPLHLLYTRPVRTSAIVGVAMAYDALACTALYVVSAALLQLVFGAPLPLFSVVPLLITFHVLSTAIQWSTRNRVVQWAGSVVLLVPFFALAKFRMWSPSQIAFTSTENLSMAAICVVSFLITVAGVARQRRGESFASPGSSGYPDRLVSAFRFACPTSSPRRAQVWFELKSTGLPVVLIGVATALLVLALFAIAIPFVPARYAALAVTTLSLPVLLLFLGANGFGIRRKQGRTFISAFEAAQPYGTAQMVALKLLVRTVCLTVALSAVGASAWWSSALVSHWGPWVLDGKDVSQGLLQARQSIGDVLRNMPGRMQAALAVIACIAGAGLVSTQAAREALRARFPRGWLIAVSLGTSCGFAAILLALATRRGLVPQTVAIAIFEGAFVAGAAAVVAAAIYLAWSGIARRALTPGYLAGAVLLAVASGAAGFAIHPYGNLFAALWSVLLFVIFILAPWSLNRIRHV